MGFNAFRDLYRGSFCHYDPCHVYLYDRHHICVFFCHGVFPGNDHHVSHNVFPDSDYNYNRAVVFYNADGAGWVKLGSVTNIEYGESTITFTDPDLSTVNAISNTRELKLRIYLSDEDLVASVNGYYAGETPVIDAMTIKGFARTPIRPIFSFPIDVSEVTARLGSGAPIAMMNQLQAWAQSAEALLLTSQHPRLQNKTVIIIPRSIRTSYIDRSNESYAADFYLELREV